MDTNARKKHLILKSCQGADLIEVLHYHACDSGSSPKSEYVKCLLNLQVQRVGTRFAVYLTGKDRLQLAWQAGEENTPFAPISAEIVGKG